MPILNSEAEITTVEPRSANKQQKRAALARVLTAGQKPSGVADREPSSANVATPAVNTLGGIPGIRKMEDWELL
jgi:hypothetical protein